MISYFQKFGVAAAVIYIFCAFAGWEVNPQTWEMVGRIMFLIVTFFTALIWYGVEQSEKK